MSTKSRFSAATFAAAVAATVPIHSEDGIATYDLGVVIRRAEDMANEPRIPPPIRKGIGSRTAQMQVHPNSDAVQEAFNQAYRPDHPARTGAKKLEERRVERDTRKLLELQLKLERRNK